MSVQESRCDTCGHVRRTYKRRFPKADLMALHDLWERTRNGSTWVHVRDLKNISGGGDFAKYRYWDLIAQRLNDDPSKKDSGFWCLTNRGARFLEGESTLYSHAIVREGECVGFSGTLVSARRVYRSAGFNYAELMSVEPLFQLLP
jgi:hypothetical protein